MPPPKLPSRYPVEFRLLFERAQAGESIEIPSTNPRSLRARLWGYARALRLDGQSELADAVQISTRGKSILIESRSNTQEAKEVTAALASLGLPTSPDEELFDQFAK